MQDRLFWLMDRSPQGDLSHHKRPQQVQALNTLAFPKDRTYGAVEQVRSSVSSDGIDA